MRVDCRKTVVRSYQLAAHVHACRLPGLVVLLDLRRDRYLSLDETECESLRGKVMDLPPIAEEEETSFGSRDEPTCTSEPELLSQLLNEELLVRASTTSSPPKRLFVKRPERSLIEGYAEVKTSITFKDVVIFLRSARSVAKSLRRGLLERLLTHDHCHTGAMNAGEFDLNYARDRMVVFNRLRPLVYTESNACLFSSLAAQRYLASYRVTSSVVIGVATNPFKAHSWLQYEDLVLNDVPEYVREYTPILQTPTF